MLVIDNHLVQSDNANHRLLSTVKTSIDEAQLPETNENAYYITSYFFVVNI